MANLPRRIIKVFRYFLTDFCAKLRNCNEKSLNLKKHNLAHYVFLSLISELSKKN